MDLYPGDLIKDARDATYDYLYELNRQARGVQPVKPSNDPFQVPEPRKPGEYQDTGATSKLHYEKGEAPAKAFVRSLGMDAKVASEVAEELGVSTNLIRKWGKDPAINAPSYEVPYGKNKIYLYTPEDVAELKRLYANQRTPVVRRA